MKYLLDTCVISELVAKQSNPQAVAWVDALEPELVYLSAITIGEIRKGIERLPDSKRKIALNAWLNDELLVRFAGQVLPLDIDVMLHWGQLTGALEAAGKKMAVMDSLIAATALHWQLLLVTRNEADFQDSGLILMNPWNNK